MSEASKMRVWMERSNVHSFQKARFTMTLGGMMEHKSGWLVSYKVKK